MYYNCTLGPREVRIHKIYQQRGGKRDGRGFLHPESPDRAGDPRIRHTPLRRSSAQAAQSHGNNRSLQLKEFNTAFYGHLPDGSPAFGDRRADPTDDPPPDIQTVPNSPSVEDPPSTVYDGAVGKSYGTSADGGEPDVQGGQCTLFDGLKRLRSPEDASGVAVKRQRLSQSEKATCTAGS